jgi:hypothetical protein
MLCDWGLLLQRSAWAMVEVAHLLKSDWVLVGGLSGVNQGGGALWGALGMKRLVLSLEQSVGTRQQLLGSQRLLKCLGL